MPPNVLNPNSKLVSLIFKKNPSPLSAIKYSITMISHGGVDLLTNIFLLISF